MTVMLRSPVPSLIATLAEVLSLAPPPPSELIPNHTYPILILFIVPSSLRL